MERVCKLLQDRVHQTPIVLILMNDSHVWMTCEQLAACEDECEMSAIARAARNCKPNEIVVGSISETDRFAPFVVRGDSV